ncbi:uncharacterized protein (TIGR02453 family) [Nonlabens dokdonensis]|jgi:uncharacterized protein (TIGR02453 family)|uniref:DUF2461 domain containing protein n=2 Tax=Nonlabens dokdonensis TaxID=328515 RepID=L7WGQ0_NONDD|nr:DUF2461 domain-containing protein [Nonlabens dokdonensis]AGC78118.1 DUF2461 domain containing protein [Nonlabens dokdonensis DSW-6]PZX37179.1 uncharacterized protein (TIGR02453 family) [Nonlabens dokdonensis]
MISPQLIEFLKQLEHNNNRDWFEEHKSQFKTLDAQFKEFTHNIMLDLNDHDVIEKTKTFRIYRDIRFSKDKTPFKVHRSANWIRSGANRRGSYYLRVKPGQTVIGVGFFAPEKVDLLRIRKEFDLDAQEFRTIITRDDFKKCWGNLQGETLKTAPRNFDKNHQDIDLIRFKSFYFLRSFSDKEMLDKNFKTIIDQSFRKARPFLDLMTDILTTDLNGESLL